MEHSQLIPDLQLVQSISCDAPLQHDLLPQLLATLAHQQARLQLQDLEIRALKAKTQDQAAPSPRVTCLQEQIAAERRVYQQLIQRLISEKAQLMQRLQRQSLNTGKPFEERDSMPTRGTANKENDGTWSNMQSGLAQMASKGKITTFTTKRKSKPEINIERYCSS